MQPEKVAWITGAGGGLGAALTDTFLEQGWKVVASGRRMPAVPPHPRVWAVSLDVTQRAEVEALARQIKQRWHPVDALINNAGKTSDALLSAMSPAAWDLVMDVNLRGAFLCSQAALDLMPPPQGGHIINLSSFSALSGPVGQANYSAAKAGLIGLTQSLARELGPRNIRVNAILPGVLQTGMTASLTPEQWKRFEAANVLGRINSLQEVVRFIWFLAETENISGQIFQLDSRIHKWA